MTAFKDGFLSKTIMNLRQKYLKISCFAFSSVSNSNENLLVGAKSNDVCVQKRFSKLSRDGQSCWEYTGKLVFNVTSGLTEFKFFWWVTRSTCRISLEYSRHKLCRFAQFSQHQRPYGSIEALRDGVVLTTLSRVACNCRTVWYGEYALSERRG